MNYIAINIITARSSLLVTLAIANNIIIVYNIISYSYIVLLEL